jgi:hypothetical protein
MSLISRSTLLSSLDAELSSVLHGSSGKVNFTIQSGEPSSLSEKDVSSFFSSLGKVDSIKYVRGKSSGVVNFCKESIARKIINKVMIIKGCTFHILQCFSDLSAYPIPYQILIESDNLPSCWEKHVIIKDFFSTFGEVTGVNYVSKTSHGVQRLVISFKKDMARMMTGTIIKVPWDKYPVFVREVSSLTLGDLKS